MPKSRFITRIAAAALAVVLVAGCGDDTSSAGTQEDEAFCESYLAVERAVIGLLFTGDGDPGAVATMLDDANAIAPASIADSMDVLTTGGKEQLETGGDASDETLEAYSATLGWARDHCDVESLDITAVDFGYEGVPDVVSPGTYIASFTNEGEEYHEVFIGRMNDGVDLTTEELLTLDDETAFDYITPVNAQDAPPGGERFVSLHLDQPGEYFLVCFVAEGSVESFDEGDGPPHAELGMHQSFTVG